MWRVLANLTLLRFGERRLSSLCAFRSEPNLGLSDDEMADGRQIQTGADVSGNVVTV